jgi:putative hemolysin
MMVPRSDIAWLDDKLSVSQALQQLAGQTSQSAHSWYPVCRGGLDNVRGMIGVAQLLALACAEPERSVGECAVPASFVPETLSGMALLEQFRLRTGRLVFVVDEYGEVQGLLTPHDLLEAITGELKPAQADAAWATPREDGSWLLDGLMPVSELKARLDIRDLPDESRGRYNTLAGLLMAEAGHLPVTGECISCAGWRFEVVDLDGRRIDKVLAQALPA